MSSRTQQQSEQDLAAAADRAEALLEDLTAQLAALEAEETLVKERVDAAIAGGGGGKSVRDLADQRDAVQLRLVSRRQDQLAAAGAAKAARATADVARFGAAVDAIDAETRASDEVLEGLLTKLARAWAERGAIVARAVALQKELLMARRRHGVAIPEPSESALTSDLLVLCEDAGPARAVLAD